METLSISNNHSLCSLVSQIPTFINLQEMMQERGLNINHTTIYRWVLEYSPELNRGLRKHLKQTGDSWRVDETYIKLNGKWMYLYRMLISMVTPLISGYLGSVTAKQQRNYFEKRCVCLTMIIRE